jgi:hypothetical protein
LEDLSSSSLIILRASQLCMQIFIASAFNGVDRGIGRDDNKIGQKQGNEVIRIVDPSSHELGPSLDE